MAHFIQVSLSLSIFTDCASPIHPKLMTGMPRQKQYECRISESSRGNSMMHVIHTHPMVQKVVSHNKSQGTEYI